MIAPFTQSKSQEGLNLSLRDTIPLYMDPMPNQESSTGKTQIIRLADSAPVSSRSTVTELAPSSEGMGKGIAQLRANFESLLRDQAIYYPVAYRFKLQLGRGRQGIVFLGERQGSRGCVTRHALKIFDPGIYPTAKKYWTDMGRLADQISMLHTVSSPNLVDRDIYEEVNGIGYIQMEVIDGLDMQVFMKSATKEKVDAVAPAEDVARFNDVIFRLQQGHPTAIQPGVALYIMRHVLRGLETLHNHGFLHADVKPGNIMLDRIGYAKLVDFGRAVRINEPMSILLGSPMYMAPEVHRREAFHVQSDIYSAGLVLLEMLRGQPLTNPSVRKESDLLDLKMKLPETLPGLLPEYVRQNKDLVRILQLFLNPDYKKRFSTAEEAEAGNLGLRLVHTQLTKSNKEAEYGREIARFMGHLPSVL